MWLLSELLSWLRNQSPTGKQNTIGTQAWRAAPLSSLSHVRQNQPCAQPLGQDGGAHARKPHSACTCTRKQLSPWPHLTATGQAPSILFGTRRDAPLVMFQDASSPDSSSRRSATLCLRQPSVQENTLSIPAVAATWGAKTPCSSTGMPTAVAVCQRTACTTGRPFPPATATKRPVPRLVLTSPRVFSTDVDLRQAWPLLSRWSGGRLQHVAVAEGN